MPAAVPGATGRGPRRGMGRPFRAVVGGTATAGPAGGAAIMSATGRNVTGAPIVIRPTLAPGPIIKGLAPPHPTRARVPYPRRDFTSGPTVPKSICPA